MILWIILAIFGLIISYWLGMLGFCCLFTSQYGMNTNAPLKHKIIMILTLIVGFTLFPFIIIYGFGEKLILLLNTSKTWK